MNKIAVVLDSNIAHNPQNDCNFDEFHIFEYDNTASFIERHDLVESVEVFLPEVVLEEITEHRRKAFNSTLSKLKNLRGQFALTNICEIPEIRSEFSENDYINGIRDRKLKGHLNIIPIPLDRSLLFNEILEKSLKKYAPFQKGKSDHGFKDAIVLSSLVEYFKKRNDYKNIYLFSDDLGFSLVDTEKIYERTGVRLEIIKNIGIQDFLIARLKLRVELKNLLDKGEFSSEIQNIIDIRLLQNEELLLELEKKGYKITEAKLTRFAINEINENECEVTCFIESILAKNDTETKENNFSIVLVFSKDSFGEWIIKISNNNE